MVAGKKFYSRRVFAVHGLLLGAVLLTCYLSVRAQYEALRDQQLEEARADQQLTTRVAAITIQNQLQLLIRGMADVDREDDVRMSIPTGWLSALALIDHQAKIVRTPIGQAGDVQTAIAEAAWLSEVKTPTFSMLPDGRVVVVVPLHGGKRLAVGLISAEQVSQDMQALTQRAANGTATTAMLPVSMVTNAEGRIVAGGSAGKSGDWIQSNVEPALATNLNVMFTTDNAGSELLPNGGVSVVSIQPFTVTPGVRWKVVSIRNQLDATVSETLRPLFWQMLSQTALMIFAVIVVLLSTTISLTRGRRRIERLRTDMLTRDLQKARRIQLNWLPAPQFDGTHVAIAAENRPALHISGDFYNWFELPKGEDDRSQKTVVVIGDVSGHGLPAAFLMATTQLLVRNTMPRLRDPGACLADINRQLCTLVYNGQFVTMMILVIDHDNAGLEIASAGHHAPLRKRGGEVDCLPIDPQLVVGVDDSVEYQTQRFRTRAGDGLLLFTDGAIEMTDPAGEQFGIERLRQVFAAADGGPKDVVAQINEALATFRGPDNEAEDDLTLMSAQIIQVDADASSDAAPSMATSG